MRQPPSSTLRDARRDRARHRTVVLMSIDNVDRLLRVRPRAQSRVRAADDTVAWHRQCSAMRPVRHARDWRNWSPSQRNRLPNLAPQIRAAFASMAWNTGSSSPGELEMTCSTSEVAVCCSSASASYCRACRPRRLPHQARGCAPRVSFPARSGVRGAANARSRLRSGRTKLATVRSALRAFARQGHLVGTLIDPGSPRPCA